MENGKGERRSGSCSRGGVLYTSAIHILQYGRGVAGRLGVAYRRHADVRRSANDWSIVTRRFFPRELFVPFSLLWPARLIRAQFTCNVCVCVCATYADPRRTVPHQTGRRFIPLGETLLLVAAYRPSSLLTRIVEGGSLYITFYTFLKNGGLL